MTLHITASMVQTWLEPTKATISAVDPVLEGQISSEVLGRLAQTFTQSVVATWVDTTTTPAVVQQIIAMYYAGWFYDRAFAEVVTDESQTSYGATLRNWASTLLADVIRGAVELADVVTIPNAGVTFYPTDASSTRDALRANTDCNDLSLGPAKFGMSKVF